jgi:hypothetical protein
MVHMATQYECFLSIHSKSSIINALSAPGTYIVNFISRTMDEIYSRD